MKRLVRKNSRTISAKTNTRGKRIMASSMSKDEMWDELLNMGISEETLDIVTSINGYSEETMLDILYAAFGYRDFDQFED